MGRWQFLHRWDRTCERAGMHDLHFHDLRHTFGTWLVQAEVDYVVIESRCEGHRATGYTMDSKNESVALRAAEALLDRGYGRPMHGVELSEQKEIRTPTLVRVTFVTPSKRDEYCFISQRPYSHRFL